MNDKNLHSEDQVDLVGIRAILFDLLRGFFGAMGFAGACIRKNKYFITLSFVLGMVLGYAIYSLRPAQYRASMIVQFNRLTKRTYAEMVDQLNHMLVTEGSLAAARDLQVSPRTAGKLRSVVALDLEDHELTNDTSTKVDQPIKIVAVLQDTNDGALDSLEQGILHYLNFSPYLHLYSEEDEKANQFKLAIINSDLAKLDTLKTEYNHFLASSKISATYYNNAVNPAEFYSQTVNLLFQRDMILRQLLVNPVPLAVLDGFKLTDTPLTRSVPKYILVFGAAAGVLAFLIAFMIETRKKVMPK
jgi:hypothetical protein